MYTIGPTPSCFATRTTRQIQNGTYGYTGSGAANGLDATVHSARVNIALLRYYLSYGRWWYNH